ncbi:MAG: hypothetical protein O2816_07540 [Planctomycetota bacterium]|nr:hypothetical protein [Planctomycetota bacterium]
MIALLALLPLLLSQDPTSRLHRAEVRLVGPLETFVWEREGGGRSGTELHLELRAGEEQRLWMPIPYGLTLAQPEVSGVPGLPSESASVLAVDDRDGELGELPVELRGRSLPPVAAQAPRLHLATLLTLVAGALVIAATRRRPPVACGLGVVVAAVAGWTQAAHPPPRPGTIRVLEGFESRWVLVEGAQGELPIDLARDLVLRSDKSSQPIRFLGHGDQEGVRWSARADDAPLWRLAPLDVGARRVSAALNLWGAFEDVWSREVGGAWSGHGTWELGQALGEGGAGAPPGWLAAGLPQGRAVLIGRLASEAWRGPEGPSDPEATWLRWIE